METDDSKLMKIIPYRSEVLETYGLLPNPEDSLGLVIGRFKKMGVPDCAFCRSPSPYLTATLDPVQIGSLEEFNCFIYMEDFF